MIRCCLLHALVRGQPRQPLQGPGETYQAPFARDRSQTTQRELPEPQFFFDDADHRLGRRLAQAVDSFAILSLKFVGHLDNLSRIIRRWFRPLGKTLAPAPVVCLTSRHDEWINRPGLKLLNISGGKVCTVQRSHFGLADLGRDGINGGNRLVRVDGMIRQCFAHDEKVVLILCHLEIVMLIKATIRAVLRNARVRIGEIALIPVTCPRLRGLGPRSAWLAVCFLGFLLPYPQPGLILSKLGLIGFYGARSKHTMVEWSGGSPPAKNRNGIVSYIACSILRELSTPVAYLYNNSPSIIFGSSGSAPTAAKIAQKTSSPASQQ